MFTDAMVPISFQVSFNLILTIGFKKRLNCSGVSNSGVKKKVVKNVEC